MDKETYYYIEFSHRGQNDWYRMSQATFDTEDGALADLNATAFNDEAFDFRILKATLATEVVGTVEPDGE